MQKRYPELILKNLSDTNPHQTRQKTVFLNGMACMVLPSPPMKAPWWGVFTVISDQLYFRHAHQTERFLFIKLRFLKLMVVLSIYDH